MWGDVMLWDNPQHRTSIYALTTGRDAGGGTTNSYSSVPVQSAVPCLINTSAANEVQLYAQQAIRVTHTISYKATALTTTLTPGMKLIADDTGDTYHVRGIRQGRAFLAMPAFVYADVEQLL